MEVKEHGVFVQIGTNNGKDEFNNIVRRSNPSKVILVEPNTELNGTILENYSGINNVFLENLAITEENKGIVTLVHPTNVGFDYFPYNDNCFSLLPMTMWGNDLVEIKTESMSFNNLCKKHGISHIDYLQIDTEGYDYEIIKSIDFNDITIDIIEFEVWTFDEDCYTNYGENAMKYGIHGMIDVGNLLTSLGYVLTKEVDDIYNVIATKQNI